MCIRDRHSTQSSKTKKRPRSVALPIEITIDEQYLNIVCENSMQDVCVYISNKSNGSIIYDEMEMCIRDSIEGALTTLPGARIVCPSFADDAAGLLRTSMRSKGFTLFLEPKALYNSVEAAAVVPEDFEVPFGKARIRREGTDLSIITYGNTCLLYTSQKAES